MSNFGLKMAKLQRNANLCGFIAANTPMSICLVCSTECKFVNGELLLFMSLLSLSLLCLLLLLLLSEAR